MDRKRLTDFLLQYDKSLIINWLQTYQNLTRVCTELSTDLARLYLEVDYRLNEKGKRLSGKFLRLKMREKCIDFIKEYEKNFNEIKLSEHLSFYLKKGYLIPKNLGDSEKLKNSLDCALTLKIIFESLIGVDIVPVKLNLQLIPIIWDLINFTSKFIDEWLEKERIADINAGNSQKKSKVRVEECRRHELYPKLEQMITSYQGNIRELIQINQIIETMVKEVMGKDRINRITIRRYRKRFFQELQVDDGYIRR